MSETAPTSAAPGSLAACPRCGLIQRRPTLGPRQKALCARCDHALDRSARASRDRARALAMAALILLPVAVGLPLMSIEKFGRVHEASLVSGTVALLVEGPILVGLIVGVCSLVMPAIKLMVIVALTQDGSRKSARVRGLAHTLIETAGRWGLLDVMLVAVLLATLKLKGLVEIHAGPGALAFTLCVALNLAASACLDPRDFWEETTT